MSISDRLQELISCKSNIKTAIEEKGVTVTGGLSSYADAVREISGEWTPPNGIKFMDSVCTYIPKFNTANITDISYMFRDCGQLRSVPELETGHITHMEQTFMYCNGLTTIPQYNTSSCITMGAMLFNCQSLESIPLLEAGKCQTITSILSGSYAIADIGGFKDLGKAMWTINENSVYVKIGTDNAFNGCKIITRESCLNIFNNLYDVRENPGGYIPELKFESEVIARLSEDDISIAVGRGWTISSY